MPLLESYGLTEASPGVTCNPLTATEYSGGIGLPLPSTEVSLRDDEGKDVPLGEPGESCIRGPQVMAGYWNRPDETARVLFVVKKDPALTEAQLLDFCRERLTGYKRPKSIEFRAELPKSNVGKLLRRELRPPTS